MVLTALIGLGLAVGGTYLLAGIVSHLIQPLSLLAALVFGVGTFLWLEKRMLLSMIGDPNARMVAHGGIAAVVGFVVFKSIAWVLAGASLLVVLLVAGLLLIGGPALLLSVARGGFSIIAR